MGQALPPDLIANLKWRTQYALNFTDELIVDLFAGGGGASTGLEMALGRPVDVAINHNPHAISLHQVNHPHTQHYISDVYEVNPLLACMGRAVGHLHASPDCTHFSQAKAGQARKRALRSLSWVVHKWAGLVRPRVITLENVEQILHWSPLVAKRCRKTGRVIKIDGSIAAPGERVPVDQQFLVPDRRRKGHNWRHFVNGLRKLGYAVEWRTLAASEFGAPTTRKRLFLVARCDGKPITWAKPTHAAKPRRGLRPLVSAAACIDWSLPTQSIFDRPRPLALNTNRRVAKGMRRFVLDAAAPFVVPAGTGIGAPTLIQTSYGERKGQEPRALDLFKPLGTVVAGGIKHSLAVAYLAQHNNHRGTVPSAGRSIDEPMSTVTVRGSQQGLVTAHLATLRRHSTGGDVRDTLPAITAGGQHHALVQSQLEPEEAATIQAALRVAAYLSEHDDTLQRPFASLSEAEQLELVTVIVDGVRYLIVDIHLRMLSPRELFRAQGFPDSYEIERGHDGRVFTKTQQVHFVGNSVSPLPMAALVAALHGEADAAAQATSQAA
jgi:DNA (cytosine-5)-methyltransferase 1